MVDRFDSRYIFGYCIISLPGEFKDESSPHSHTSRAERVFLVYMLLKV